MHNDVDGWLCMCMADDCIGFAFDLYRFLIFLVCKNSEPLHRLLFDLYMWLLYFWCVYGLHFQCFGLVAVYLYCRGLHWFCIGLVLVFDFFGEYM